MTKADRVCSTPPTNTSVTRRKILGTAAVVAAAGSIAGFSPAIASALPDDPIYAAIERHKAARGPWDAAINVRAEFPENPMTAEQWEQRDLLDAAVDDARGILEKTGIDLINTAPTTLGGIARALNYIREQMLQQEGVYMPSGLALKDDDYPEIIGWIEAFLDTIEHAARELDRAGKAVLS